MAEPHLKKNYIENRCLSDPAQESERKLQHYIIKHEEKHTTTLKIL